MAKSNAFDFEQSLKELEMLVQKMEQEPLSLQQSLENFEQGVKLTKQCQKALEEAEQHVKVISQSLFEATAKGASQDDPEA